MVAPARPPRPPSTDDPLAPLQRRPSASGSRATFEAPTQAQAEGWAAIAAGRHTLIHAPTGSGKTLAAFLWTLDRLVDPAPTEAQPPGPRQRPRPVHQPAQGADLRRRAQPAGAARRASRLAAQRLGEPAPDIAVGIRTGDTPAEDRRDLARHPPDILITTPESLYLLLTSQAREILTRRRARHRRRGPRDRRHQARRAPRAVARTAGATSQRRAATDGDERARRSGSGCRATQRPLETIARFLGGIGPGREVDDRRRRHAQAARAPGHRPGRGHGAPRRGPAARRAARAARRRAPRRARSIWPAIHPRILELIRPHRSTIVFINSRRLAERLAPAPQRARRRGAGPRPPRLDRPRAAPRRSRRSSRPAACRRWSPRARSSSASTWAPSTSSSRSRARRRVARGLQRVGRAGHQVGEPSRRA